MLLFEKFDEIAKDPIVYPYFNQDVAQALPEQMLRTITDHLLTRERRLPPAVHHPPHLHDPRRWARSTRCQVPQADRLGALRVRPRDDRAGLLGQAGFLALYSHSGRSSPTLRGRAIRELLMCQPVPNPPGNVNFTAVQDTANKAMPTARVRLTAHNTDPVCAGCHKITDPVGLSLERFDGIGEFRADRERGPDRRQRQPWTAARSTAPPGWARRWPRARIPPNASPRALRICDRPAGAGCWRWSRRLEKRFAAGGYGIRALFARVATHARGLWIANAETAAPMVRRMSAWQANKGVGTWHSILPAGPRSRA